MYFEQHLPDYNLEFYCVRYNCINLVILKNQIMNKAELTKNLANRMSVTQSQSQKFLDTFQEILSEELKKDNNLSLLGFGVFSPWKQTERIGRNPRTGVECVIKPRLSVKFKPATRFLETLNDETKKKNGKVKTK